MGVTLVDKVLDVPETDFNNRQYYSGSYDIQNGGTMLRYLLWSPTPTEEWRQPLPMRINSACLITDLFGGSQRCDCKWQLDYAMNLIASVQNGLVLYGLDEDGRGHGTTNKLRSYKLMDEKGLSTKEAFEELDLHPVDMRNFENYAFILGDLGVQRIMMITNNPEKVNAMQEVGIEVVMRIPAVLDSPTTKKYLRSKAKDFNHLIGE